MMDPYMMEKLAIIYQQEVLHEAELRRLASCNKQKHAHPMRYIVGRIGIVMVVFGSKLETFGKYGREAATI